MIKVILFDFWGTVAENGIWSPVKQVQSLLHCTLPFSEYVLRMERAMMTEPCDSIRTAMGKVCAEFEVKPTEALLEQLIGLWNKNWMLAKPYPETITTLQELKGKYILALISNTDSISIKNVLTKFNLGFLFGRLFLSYDLHLLKSDPVFLETVAVELEVGVEEIVVVGDSIQSDMIPAKRIKMNAILIDRNNSRDFHPKIKNLQEVEGVVSKL